MKRLTPLETERLWLRHMVPSDIDYVRKMLGDPRMTLYLGKQPFTWTAESWLARTLERLEKDGISFLAVELKPARTFIGQIGLLLQDVEGKKEVEVGYHLLPEYWGKGYASEAARACMEWGFANLDCQRIISLIHPDNRLSSNVAKRNGLIFKKEIQWRDCPTHVYEYARQVE